MTGLGGVVTGRSDIGNAAAASAEDDVLRAHHDATGAGPATEMSGVDLGGKTLGPGVYHFGSSAALHGTLTLDGEGASNPTFIFQIGSTLTTGTGARVRLTNGADGCAVFWAVGSSATIGTATSLQGNLMALVSITMTTGATIGVGGGRNGGRAFAQNGAITLDTNTIIAPTGHLQAPAPTPEADAEADPEADSHSRPRSPPRRRRRRRPRRRRARGHAPRRDADAGRISLRQLGTQRRPRSPRRRAVAPGTGRRSATGRSARTERLRHRGGTRCARSTFDGGGIGIIGPFVVPGFLAAASGLLLILLMLAQALGTLAWLPVVRRRVGSFGFGRR